jgi:hypothetical protein
LKIEKIKIKKINLEKSSFSAGFGGLSQKGINIKQIKIFVYYKGIING